ncbi:hypothetical protein WA158_006638 [Blastocystis sp. Blastoise]
MFVLRHLSNKPHIMSKFGSLFQRSLASPTLSEEDISTLKNFSNLTDDDIRLSSMCLQSFFKPNIRKYLSKFDPDTNILWINKDKTIIISENKTHVCISYRGTFSMNDVKDDLRYNPVPFQNGFVHEGFFERSMSTNFSCLPNMKDKNDSRVLLLCGHSLGGAAAQITYILLRQMYPTKVIRLFTTGTPFCFTGNIDYSIFISRDMMNIIYHNDPIPFITNYEPYLTKLYKTSNDYKSLVSLFLSENAYGNVNRYLTGLCSQYEERLKTEFLYQPFGNYYYIHKNKRVSCVSSERLYQFMLEYKHKSSFLKHIIWNYVLLLRKMTVDTAIDNDFS